MKEIILTQNKVTLVDDEDYEYLNHWKWYAYKYKKGTTYYAGRNTSRKLGSQKRIPMHNQLLGYQDNNIIDHKDGNGLNNQKTNIRFCTFSQNSRNKKGFSSSNYKGVYKKLNRPNRIKCYEASIYFNNKSHYLGSFKTPQEAAIAYNKAAILNFGEFARLNNINIFGTSSLIKTDIKRL